MNAYDSEKFFMYKTNSVFAVANLRFNEKETEQMLFVLLINFWQQWIFQRNLRPNYIQVIESELVLDDRRQVVFKFSFPHTSNFVLETFFLFELFRQDSEKVFLLIKEKILEYSFFQRKEVIIDLLSQVFTNEIPWKASTEQEEIRDKNGISVIKIPNLDLLPYIASFIVVAKSFLEPFFEVTQEIPYRPLGLAY